VKPIRRIAAVLGLLLLAGTALAQHDLPVRPMNVQWSAGVPRLAFSATQLVDAEVRRDLGSGLQKTIVVTVQAFPERGTSPVATRQYACAVTYDLWQDAYVLRMGRHTTTESRVEAVVRGCLQAENLTVGSASDFVDVRGESIYFAVRAEFNPISGRRCRELLRSSGSDAPLGPLVINIVRREICQAQRAIDFRSSPVTVP